MVFKHKTEHYEIIDYERPIEKKVINSCKTAYEKNKCFFKKDTPYFKIFICNNEDRFKKLLGKSYSPWVKGIGRSLKQKLIVRSPAELLKCYKKHGGTNDFNKLMIHETNHMFAINLYLRKKRPLWLIEGLATVMEKRDTPNEKELIANAVPGVFYYKLIKKKSDKYVNFKGINSYSYKLWCLITKYIIKEYGMNKIRILLETMPRTKYKKQYEKNFEKIFGRTEKQVIKEFLNQ